MSGRIRFICLTFIMGLLSGNAFAELQFSSEVGTRTLTVRNHTDVQILVQPELQWDPDEAQRLYFKPYAQLTPQSLADEEKKYIDCSECYYRWKGESSRLNVGMQIFNWGVTDGYNPLDIVNARIYSEPIHARKRGEFAISYAAYFANWEFLFGLIPQKAESIMPGEKSTWLPQEVYITSGESSQILNLPEHLIYHYQQRDRVPGALLNNGMFSLMGHFEDFDFGLYTFEGGSNFPIINVSATGTITQVSPKIIIQANPDIYLTVKDYRLRAGGVSLVWNKMGILWKAAAMHTQSLGNDSDLPGWQSESVIAVEKSVDFKNDYLLTTILQSSQTKAQGDSETNMMNFSRFFQRNIMLAARLGIGEKWTTTLFMAQDLQFGSHVEECAINYRNDAGWSFNLSYDMMSGNSESPLGSFAKNDLVTLALKKIF